MTPLAVLMGIVMGSAVTITIGLALVLCVFLLMGHDYPFLVREYGPLLQSFFLFLALAFVSSYGFVGVLRERSWRFWAVAATAVNVAGLAWHYWPR
jgi:hypothetical protein